MSNKYEDDDFEPNEEEEVEDDDDEEEINPATKQRPIIKNTIKNEDNEEDEEMEDEDMEDEDNEEDEEMEDDEIGDENDIEEFNEDKIFTQSNFPQFNDLDNDDEDEDDDDNGMNYLQKFDENIQHNIIADFHPELKSHNYDEIDILSRVVRDEDGTIIDPLHKTLPFITRYEKARILGERAKQINSGAHPLVEVDATVIDGYLIALKEFEEKKIPFIIKRPLPNGGCEYWRFRDLEILV